MNRKRTIESTGSGVDSAGTSSERVRRRAWARLRWAAAALGESMCAAGAFAGGAASREPARAQETALRAEGEAGDSSVHGGGA